MTVYAVQYCGVHTATTLRSLWSARDLAVREAERVAAGMTREDCAFGFYEVWEFGTDDPAGGESLSSHHGPYPSRG